MYAPRSQRLRRGCMFKSGANNGDKLFNVVSLYSGKFGGFFRAVYNLKLSIGFPGLSEFLYGFVFPNLTGLGVAFSHNSTYLITKKTNKKGIY